MKNRITILVLALFIIPFLAQAQQIQKPEFSPPVPVGSDPNQVGQVMAPTSTLALFLKSFKHPKNPDQTAKIRNFENDTLTLNWTDSKGVVQDWGECTVNDLVGMPGNHPWFDQNNPERLLSLSKPFDVMVDPLLTIGTPVLKPRHGLSPPPQPFPPTTTYKSFQLRDQENLISFQLQIADIRNSDKNEYEKLFGKTCPQFLPNCFIGLIGSAQESVSPYNPQTYPADVTSIMKAFNWGKLGQPLNYVYINAIPYGIANLKNGLASAIYDTITAQGTVDQRTLDATNNVVSSQSFQSDAHIFTSPIVYFRNETDANGNEVGRMQLSGYSHNGILLPKQLPEALTELSPGLNPIAVKEIEIDPSDDLHDFAVINQATLFDINQPVIDIATGQPKIFGDGKSHIFKEILGTGSVANFVNISDRIPHPVVSYATIMKQALPWEKRIDNNNNTLDDPNVVFKPHVHALIGSGAYDAAQVIDTVQGKKRQTVIVASGENICPRYDRNCGNVPENTFYFYQIDPNDKDALKHAEFNPSSKIASVSDLPFVVANPIKVTSVPNVANFVPYNIASADFNNDGCSDLVFTWRGKTVVPWIDRNVGNPSFKTADFTNDYSQHVQFDDNISTRRFGDYLTILYSNKSKGCSFADAKGSPSYKRIDLRLDIDAEVPLVTTGDVNGDGDVDILVGTTVGNILVIYNDKDYTTRKNIQPPPVDRFYYDITKSPNQQGNLDFLNFKYFKEREMSALSVDQHPNGANLSAVVGYAPVMLPPMGCSEKTNLDVDSPFEALQSVATNESAMKFDGMPPGSLAHFKRYGSIPCYSGIFAKKNMIPCSCKKLNACTIGGEKIGLWEDDFCCSAFREKSVPSMCYSLCQDPNKVPDIYNPVPAKICQGKKPRKGTSSQPPPFTPDKEFRLPRAKIKPETGEITTRINKNLCAKKVVPPPVPPPPQPAKPPITPPQRPFEGGYSCISQVTGFSDVGMGEIYQKLNADVVAKTGSNFEIIGEPGVSTDNIICTFKDSVDAKGSILPYAIIQTGEHLYVDFTADFTEPPKLKDKGFSHVMIFPPPSANAILPQLSLAGLPSGAPSYQAIPDVTIQTYNNQTIINKVFNVEASKSSQPADSVIKMHIKFPPLTAPRSGEKEIETLMSEIENRMKQGIQGSEISYNIAAEKFLSEDFLIAQDTTSGKPTVAKLGIISLPPEMYYKGGGRCKCSMNGEFDAASTLGDYILLIFTLAGLAMMRIIICRGGSRTAPEKRWI
ncbi:MAG: hypothetical protein ABIE74_09160 [Pseudomonadota bacterium]